MKYRILILLSVLTGIVAYHWRGKSWWIDTYATNLSATFVGTFFIVLFVDRAVEQARERERRRVELIALNQARKALVQMVSLFSDILKASSSQVIIEKPESLRSLFSPDRVSSFDNLDLTGNSGTVGNTPWYDHIRDETKRICDTLSGVVDKYIAYLGIEFVEGTEALCSDPFLILLRNLGGFRTTLRAQSVTEEFSLQGLGPWRDEFFAKLLRVTDYVHTVTGKGIEVPESITREDILPRTGSSRLQDLTAHRNISIAAGPPPTMPVTVPEAPE